MRLLIAIGYESHESSADPFPVYVGRKHEEMVQAMEASRAVRFEIVKNPTVLRKRAAAKPSPKAVATEDEGLQWAAAITPGVSASLPEVDLDAVSPEAAALDTALVSPEAAALDADDEAAAADAVADPAPVSGKRKR